MNKITTLTIIAAAALLLGTVTSNFLVANATGTSGTGSNNQSTKNNNQNNNQNNQNDHQNNQNNDQNHNYNHDDNHDDDDEHDDTHSGNHTKGGGSVVIDPPTVKVYKVVINNEGNPVPTIASFGIKLNNTQIATNGTMVTVAQNKPAVLTESGLVGYEFVEIRGDGHCPENLGGTITLDNAQHIECYIVNRPAVSTGPVQPGVIFRYNTLEFNRVDPSAADSCSAPGKTDPCVELANVGNDRSILVVDDALKTDTTIVLFSVIENGKIGQNPPQFATSPLCTLSGIGPHTASYAQDPDFSPVTNPTGKLGFEFQCSLFEAESYKVSYALIETKR